MNGLLPKHKFKVVTHSLRYPLPHIHQRKPLQILPQPRAWMFGLLIADA